MALQLNNKEVEENLSDTSLISSSWMVLNLNFRTPNKEIVGSLKEVWERVVSESIQTSSKEDSWWERLVEFHSAPDRAYHTLIHLKEMIGFFKILASTSSSSFLLDKKVEIVMILSIFFHDAVYDAKSSSNEEASARLFQEFCSDMGGFKNDYKDVEENVVKYILATKLHKLPVEENKNETNTDLLECLKLFLDIDMAVLGKREPAYMHYARLIRQEYSFVEHHVYCEKRADILERFLEEPKIYYTGIMHNALEDAARTNLRKEIEFLRKGTIPGEN